MNSTGLAQHVFPSFQKSNAKLQVAAPKLLFTLVPLTEY